jgi:hypothetical protein
VEAPRLKVAYREFALRWRWGRDRKSMMGMSMFTLSMKDDERRKLSAENPQS